MHIKKIAPMYFQYFYSDTKISFVEFRINYFLIEIYRNKKNEKIENFSCVYVTHKELNLIV